MIPFMLSFRSPTRYEEQLKTSGFEHIDTQLINLKNALLPGCRKQKI
jgi:hypothetical protein